MALLVESYFRPTFKARLRRPDGEGGHGTGDGTHVQNLE